MTKLGEVLVKHVLRVEREVEETKNMRENITSYSLDENTTGK